MLNRVELIGNLGANPEIRYMTNGSAVLSISLATNRRWKDKQTGEKREASEWHRVIFFNRLAEIAGEYLGKGDKIYVSGRLQTRQWEKDGQKHYTTEIIATDMLMLETNKANGDYSVPENSSRHSARNNQPDTRSAPPTPPLQNYDDFDDDIPF